MTQQTEAQRLADALQTAVNQTDAEDDVVHVARWFVEDSAAELRRLDAANKELLEALEGVMYWSNGKHEWAIAQAAIAKHGGQHE